MLLISTKIKTLGPALARLLVKDCNAKSIPQVVTVTDGTCCYPVRIIVEDDTQLTGDGEVVWREAEKAPCAKSNSNSNSNLNTHICSNEVSRQEHVVSGLVEKDRTHGATFMVTRCCEEDIQGLESPSGRVIRDIGPSAGACTDGSQLLNGLTHKWVPDSCSGTVDEAGQDGDEYNMCFTGAPVNIESVAADNLDRVLESGDVEPIESALPVGLCYSPHLVHSTIFSLSSQNSAERCTVGNETIAALDDFDEVREWDQITESEMEEDCEPYLLDTVPDTEDDNQQDAQETGSFVRESIIPRAILECNPGEEAGKDKVMDFEALAQKTAAVGALLGISTDGGTFLQLVGEIHGRKKRKSKNKKRWEEEDSSLSSAF